MFSPVCRVYFFFYVPRRDQAVDNLYHGGFINGQVVTNTLLGAAVVFIQKVKDRKIAVNVKTFEAFAQHTIVQFRHDEGPGSNRNIYF